MNVALVVARSEEDRSLIVEAARLAAGVDATLVVLYLLSPEEFDDHIDVREQIGAYETMQGGDPTEEELARSRGEALLAEIRADTDLDLDPEILGAVSDDDAADPVLEAARTVDCDHIFIGGRKRSPTGKALFGDVAQSVLLRFEGYVTVDIRD